MIVIPTSPIAAQTFNIVLDGQYCTISLYWKQTRLYFDLTVGATSVCVGRICQNRVNILQVPVRGFSGTLHFWDMEGDSPPNWEKLNSRFYLVYVSEGETFPPSLEF